MSGILLLCSFRSIRFHSSASRTSSSSGVEWVWKQVKQITMSEWHPISSLYSSCALFRLGWVFTLVLFPSSSSCYTWEFGDSGPFIYPPVVPPFIPTLQHHDLHLIWNTYRHTRSLFHSGVWTRNNFILKNLRREKENREIGIIWTGVNLLPEQEWNWFLPLRILLPASSRTTLAWSTWWSSSHYILVWATFHPSWLVQSWNSILDHHDADDSPETVSSGNQKT